MPNPTVPPAALTPPDPAVARTVARDHNGREIEALLDHTPLPHATITPTPEEVIVTAGTLDDLAQWAHALGGSPLISPLWEGTETWTLRTSIPASHGDSPGVGLRVSATVAAGVPVPEALEGASRMRAYGHASQVCVDRRPVGAVLDVSAHMQRVLTVLAVACVENGDEMAERLGVLADGGLEADVEMERLLEQLEAAEIRVWQPGHLAAALATCASPEERKLIAEAQRPISQSEEYAA